MTVGEGQIYDEQEHPSQQTLHPLTLPGCALNLLPMT